MNTLPLYLKNAAAYLMVGFACALTEWTTFFLTVSTGFSFVAGALAGFAIATALNYILSATLVFRSRGRSRLQEIGLTYLISLVVMGINLAITALIISYLPKPPDPMSMTAAKMAGTGFGLVLNYLGRQMFIFDRNA